VGKGVVGVGEERFLRAESGAAIVMRLWVEVVPGRRLDEELGSLARRIWPSFARKAHQSGPAPTASTVGRRLEYLDRRHWDPVLGQYASPDGSGTAMAGFVEMSLGMAIAAARIRHLGFRSGSSGTLEQDLGAIDRWVGAGGPLMPVWKGGQAVGGRRAYDQPGLPTTTAPLVEASRIAVEARHLLGLVRQGVARDERAGRWHAAARATADWLLARCRDGVLPIVVEDAAEGAVLRPIGDASAFLVSLLGELAVGESDGSVRQRLADRAAEVHQAAVEPRIQARRFGGTTLDAASPDREAAVAVLDAALAMHELTADERYLRDARIAADALLAWIVAHPVGTFQPGTDAAERRISTIGASLVSPENQHLDPFPIGGSLVRYGLYAGDMVAVRAGQANLAWCLDGRWATQTPDGIRQSEQLLHTRWHYDPWATERGDIRLGIPWSDGSAREHGWPQAVPLLGLLDHGHVALDWPTGRVSALPGIRMTRARTAHGYVLRLPDAPVTGPGLLVRVLRPPGPLVVRMRGRAGPLPWPRSLAVIIVSGDWAAIEAPLGAAIPTTRKRLQSC